MAKINLLPWREELRKQKKKDFFTLMGVLAVATLIAFVFIHTYIDGRKKYHERRNEILNEEITKLDQKLGEIAKIEERKNALLAKIDLIQKLQESRPEIVHLLDEIPRTTPDGIFLSKFTQTAQSLAFEGKTQAHAKVSAFMRAIDNSKWLHTPLLEEVRAEDAKEAQSFFKLKATLGKKDAEADKKKVPNANTK